MPLVQKILGILRGRNFRLYIAFVVVASLFWLIEQLRRDYTTAIQIPIEAHTAPDNYVLDKESTQGQSLRALVSSDGFTLLQYYLSDYNNQKLNVDVSRLPRVQTKDGAFAVIAPSQFYTDISNDIPDHIELRGVINDSIFIPLHRARKKYLPVVSRVNYGIEQQHILSDKIRISPSHVWVNGTNNILDTMEAIYTKPTEYFMLHDTLTLSLAFDLPTGVETNVHSVDVTFCVEPFTEKTLEVPITAVNVPDGYIFKAFPHTARVTFTVGMSSFEKVGVNNIDVVADLSTIDLKTNNQQKVKLHLASAPENITNVTYSPLFVEFLLEKKSGNVE